MSATILLIVFLSAGYLFATTCTITNTYIARDTGHSLYFKTAIYSIFLFIYAVLTRLILLGTDWYPAFEIKITDTLKEAINVTSDDTALLIFVAVYAFIWAVALSQLLNAFTKWIPYIWLKSLEKAIEHNELEKLIYMSVTEDKLLTVTMDSGKFYIGWCDNLPNPSNVREWVQLLPLFSGYRHEETKHLEFTTDYLTVYEEIKEGDDIHYIASNSIKDFRISLPVNKIASINVFNLQYYDRFHGNPSYEAIVELDEEPDNKETKRLEDSEETA